MTKGAREMRCRDCVLWALVTVTFAFSYGCAKPANDPSRSRLSGIAELYSEYIISHRGVAPTDQRAFLDFAEQRNDLDQLLGSYGVSSLEELLVSTSDGQPFELKFGQPDVNGIIGYDSSPVDGQRWVAFRSGLARLMAEPDFQQMLAGD